MSELAARIATRAERLAAGAAPAGWRWVAILAIAGALLALVAARVAGPGGPWLWNWDLPKIDYPLAALYHAALREGRLPLWSDDLGLGFPLYAEGQIGAFYPPNWIIYQLPPLVALDVSRVVHLAVAGTGSALLAARITGSRAGGLAALAIVVLGGAIGAKLQWTNLVAAYAWLPWVLLPLVRRPAPTTAGLATAGIAWGVQALAGHPNTWALTGLAAAVILLASAPRPATIGRIAAFGTLGVAIGAVQLVPTLVLVGLSVRSAGLSPDDVFTSAATPFDPLLLGFVGAFARWDEGSLDVANTWYPDGGFALLEAGAYVGLAALALAAAGSRSRRARPWLVLAAAMIAIPVAAAFRPAAWMDVPLLDSLRSPTRAYLVVQLAIAMLAAIGVARLGRGPGAGRRALLVTGAVGALYPVTLLVAIAAPGAFQALYRVSASGPSDARIAAAREVAIEVLGRPTPHLLLDVVAGATALALVAGWARAGRPWPRLHRGAAIVALVGPLALLAPAVNRVEPATMHAFADTPLVRAIRTAEPSRVLMVDEPVWHEAMPDQLAAAGIAGIDMFSSLDLAASDELRRSMERGPDAAALRHLAGVDVVVQFGGEPCPADGGVRVEVGFPPAPWLTSTAHVCRGPAAPAGPSWLPATAAAAGEASGSALRPREATLDAAAAAAGARSAVVTARDDGQGRYEVDAPADGWAWIDRAWWPAWLTTVDGEPATALRAAAGRLVPVPAGRHRVEERLVPWDALLGLAAGLAALALVAAGLVVDRRRRARPGSAPGVAAVSPWARRRP